MNALLAAGLFLIAFITIVGAYSVSMLKVSPRIAAYIITVDLCMVLIEVASGLVLLG